MKVKRLKEIFIVLLLSQLTGISASHAVDGKYGFASGDMAGCTFSQTPLPISFTRDDDHTNSTVQYNVFYVRDGVKGMDDYIDFYTTLGDHESPKSTTEEDAQFWPQTPYMFKGRDKPICTADKECYSDNDTKGGYDKGRSKYDIFKNDYTADELKIAADVAPTSGRAYRQYFDVRKLKFLRVEVFTPYLRNDANTLHVGYTEPLFFEYHKISGSSNTLALTSYGTTSNTTMDELKSMLPSEINLNLVRYIYVYINSLSNSAFQGKVPVVAFNMLTTDQQSRLPEACRSR